MIETHAFGNFVPPKAGCIILGSFTGRQAVKGNIANDPSYDWFYATKRNQFWPILEAVYGLELKDTVMRKKLFTDLGIAMADIIYQCERKKGNNLDTNLTNFIYNTKAIAKILNRYPINKILFSSCFVEKKFKQIFKEIIIRHPEIELVTLPSPSPRYATMRLNEKIEKYKKLLPKG
ncbi:hypothetical protein KJ953_04795 [Patescibacteria group bacterium]|nr:hypothetical protein [Patescibacteria group bacterium]MBU1256224.1 hypothetical protein [Patescibacteria group bacterium]MBU1457764.1 hypothetical protein [Patescibacteria group bacterium]